MKTFLCAALAAFVALTGVANAGGVLWSKQLAWHFPANVTTSPFTQNVKALAAGGTDTTVWVGTNGWYVPDQAAADSTVIGRFILFVDSSAVYSPAQTTLTAVVDGTFSPVGGVLLGNALPNANNVAISQSITPTTGAKVMVVPILLGSLRVGAGTTANGWSMIAPQIRLRLATSAAINACGVAVQYMLPPGIVLPSGAY